MTTREDPLIGYNYRLDVQGKVVGFFTECDGLGSENEIIEHPVVTPEGLEIIMKLPGRLKWGDITLKRGITSNMDAWNWRGEVERGDLESARKNGLIQMMDRNLRDAVAEWTFDAGWPSKLSGPSLGAESNDIGIEEITIVHEGIRRAL
jgi:phage tail-like protein